MTVTIQNLTSGALSLDIELGPERNLRRSLPLGGSTDVSDLATLDELLNNSQIQALRDAGSISVTGDFGLRFPDDGAGLVFTAPKMASSTAGLTSATAAGVIRVQVGTATRYINLFSGAPST